MRAHFVDGPAHGMTIQLEGNAPGTMYLPSMVTAPSIVDRDDALAPMWLPSQEYRIRGHASEQTVIYVYAGLSR